VSLLPSLTGETEHNPHIWLDAGNAVIMVENLAEGLMTAMPRHAEAIAANRDAYCARLTALDGELTETLAPVRGGAVITFHEAFPYFAEAYGLEVAAVIAKEPGDALSPRELAELIATVRELGCPPLFTEPQYADIAARTVAEETGAAVRQLDPCVTGPGDGAPLTYYEEVMRRNAETLLEALDPDGQGEQGEE
jgi:zinc transport system substrate-binding protein